MARVTVYATPFCLYCVGAKAFLKRHGIPYDEVRINMFTEGARDRLQAESGGGRTFPQVVIDGDPIGGFDSLRAISRSGELARRLGAPAPQSPGGTS
jgi:glutaredoxin 3